MLTTFLESWTEDICNAKVDTFCFIAERSLLHKILEVLLKDCRGPHKGCLGDACGSQNGG